MDRHSGEVKKCIPVTCVPREPFNASGLWVQNNPVTQLITQQENGRLLIAWIPLTITNQPEYGRDGNYTTLGESRYSEIDTLKFVQ